MQTFVFHRALGGLGDIVTTLGAVQSCRDLHPDGHFIYIGPSPINQILKYHPAINEIRDIGGRLPEGKFINFGPPCPSNKYESSILTRKSRIKIFADAADVHAQVPKIYMGIGESEFGEWWLDHELGRDCFKVGVVLRSAEKWKDYRYPIKVAKNLRREQGIGVVTIDHEIETRFPNTTGFSIRQIASVIKNLDLLITPDTGWLHVSGALGTRMLVTIGAQCPIARIVPYGRKHRWIQGHCPYNQMPCWYDICNGRENFQPCMEFSWRAVYNLALEMLSQEDSKSGR